jgi:hypothetical protein
MTLYIYKTGDKKIKDDVCVIGSLERRESKRNTYLSESIDFCAIYYPLMELFPSKHRPPLDM